MWHLHDSSQNSLQNTQNANLKCVEPLTDSGDPKVKHFAKRFLCFPAEKSSPVSGDLTSGTRGPSGPGLPPTFCLLMIVAMAVILLWWLLLFSFLNHLQRPRHQAKSLTCFVSVLTTTPCGKSPIIPILHVRKLGFGARGTCFVLWLGLVEDGFELSPLVLQSACSDPPLFSLGVCPQASARSLKH